MMKIFDNFKEKFFEIENYEFSLLSKIVILIFAIFVFAIISFGIDIQLQNLKTPEQSFGEKCIYLIKDNKKINLEYIIDDLNKKNKIFSFGENSYCRDLNNLYINLLEDEFINKDYKTYKKVNLKIDEIEKDIKIKNQYDEYLIEKIKNSNQSTIYQKEDPYIEKTLSDKEVYLKNLFTEKDLLNDLIEHRDYQKLFEYIKINENIIVKEYKNYLDDYPFIKLFKIVLFLIPLFVISFILNSYFIKKKLFILSRLFISISLVSGIYLIYQLLVFLYNLLPKFLLQSIFDFFIDNNLIFLFNYLVIFLFVLVFFIFIWKIQLIKKQKNEKKSKSLYFLKENRCTNCGCKRLDNYKYCPSCGDSFYEECKFCKNLKIKNSPFCNHCGANSTIFNEEKIIKED